MTTDLSVNLAPRHPNGLHLSNPMMIASGTLGYDGYGRGLIGNYPLQELGAVIPKTVTRWPREGNAEPRWYPESYREAWESGDHLFLNAIGLINPGIETAVREWTPTWTEWNATVFFSFAAHSVGEFGEMAAMTNEAVGISALELNLSCPNIENGAMFSYSPALTHDAVAAVKANTGLPVLAKLSPNVPDITEIARAAVDGGADALSICNTLPAMRIDLATRRPALGNITGGLSGMGLRPVSLALVYQAAQAVDAPIIGVGGIFEAEHALEYIMAGATAVQVGSANLVNLGAPWRILKGMQEYLSDNQISSLTELQGAAHSYAFASTP
jgi:dihydroorotate dehydrogenase (NAD+) catalytic subunit